MDPIKYRLVHSHGYANGRLGQGAKGIVPQNFRPSACKRPPNIQMTPSSIWSPRWPTPSDEPQAPTALATDTHLLSRIVSWLPIGTKSQATWMRLMWLTRGNLGVAASSCHHQGRDRPIRHVRRVRLNRHGRHSPSSCRSCRVIEPARPDSERPPRPTRQATTAPPHPRVAAVRRPGSLDSLPTVGRQCRRRHSRPVRECTGRGDHPRSASRPFTRHPGVVRTERSQVQGYPRFGREGLVRTGIAGSGRPPLRQGGNRPLVEGPGNRPWTAEMFLLGTLGRLDVWPVGDYGVRAGYALSWRLPDIPSPTELMALGDPYRPYRSVVAWYCWRALDARI